MASSEARHERLVAYSPQRREYLSYDCCSSTTSRVWAWSGTLRQARNMVQVYPYSGEFSLYWDGEEGVGSPVDVS